MNVGKTLFAVPRHTRQPDTRPLRAELRGINQLLVVPVMYPNADTHNAMLPHGSLRAVQVSRLPACRPFRL